MFRAPTHTNDSRSAVDGAYGMATHDTWPVVCIQRFSLLGRHADHQAAPCGAKHRDEHAHSEPPTPGRTRKPLLEERCKDPDTCQPEKSNCRAHDSKQGAIKRRADVEMTCGATRRLNVDDCDFQYQDDRYEPSHGGDESRPDRNVAEEPGQSAAVDSGRDGEFCGFEPGGYARDDAMIEKDTRHGCGKDHEHHETGCSQRSAVRPRFPNFPGNS